MAPHQTIDTLEVDLQLILLPKACPYPPVAPEGVVGLDRPNAAKQVLVSFGRLTGVFTLQPSCYLLLAIRLKNLVDFGQKTVPLLVVLRLG